MKKMADFFKALGDENRLKIIEMLSVKDMCVCEIIDELEMSQPAISHHLKILRQAGILTDTKEGKWIYYSLNRQVLQQLDNQFKLLIQRATTATVTNRTNDSKCMRLSEQQNPLKPKEVL